MQYNTPPVGAHTMLEEVHALPCAQREFAVMDRNRELNLRKCGADVGSHVVGAFRGVPVEVRVFGDKAREEIGQVGNDVRVGIFLNHQRRGSMLAKNRQQSGVRVFPPQPRLDLSREFVEPFAVSRDVDLMGLLLHSTVTLLARLRG